MATRTIFLAGSPDGQKMWGEGATCKKISTGTYMIEFDQPFKGYPVPVVTVSGPPWQTFNMSAAIIDVNPHNCVLLTSSPNQPVDAGFSIIIAGSE